MIAKTWLWAQIWLAIKPNLKCTQFGKFKKEYEDKIALAEANIDGALEERAKVQAAYDGLAGQKNELSLALKSGGSAVQEIIDKTTRIEGQAAEVQNELTGVQNRIKGEKQQKLALEGQIAKINSTVAQMEGEVKDNWSNSMSMANARIAMSTKSRGVDGRSWSVVISGSWCNCDILNR